MIIKPNRNESYVGTVNLSDTEDQAWVRTVRSSISDVNAIRKSNGDPHRQYVKLHGRGPRAHNGRRYNISLPLKYAVNADIYVYSR
jgi:hypothetical protein